MPSALPGYGLIVTTASKAWAHGPGDTRADNACPSTGRAATPRPREGRAEGACPGQASADRTHVGRRGNRARGVWILVHPGTHRMDKPCLG